MLLLVILFAIFKIVFFYLYVSFEIVTVKSVVSLRNIEKSATLNTKGLKRETKRLNMRKT